MAIKDTKKRINVALPKDVVDRMDVLTENFSITRNALCGILISSALPLYERVLNPEQWMVDPKVIEMLQILVKDSDN